MRLELPLAAVIYSAACAGAPPPDPYVAQAPDTAPAMLTLEEGAPERLMEHIAWLADDARGGRAAGTPDEAAVVEWIGERFEEIGLQPVYEEGWLQSFDATTGVTVDPSTTGEIRGGWILSNTRPRRVRTNIRQLALGEDFAVAEGSASGRVAGRAVFVGHGIVATAHGHDDYEGLDVEGKIVVLVDGAPTGVEALERFGDVRTKLHVARERGAVGAIVLDADDELVEPRDAADMGIPAIVLKSSVATVLVGYGDAPDRGTLLPPAVVFEVAVAADRRTAHNVVGVLRADGPRADEVVVVGAHHDHLGRGGRGSLEPDSNQVHNGADDNASGVALVLEVARALAAHRERLRRTIVFIAFGAEELGVLGSAHWVRNRPEGLENVVAMVNADMVGRLRDDRLNLLGAGTSPVWGRLADLAVRDLSLELVTSADGFGPSDQTSFYAARVPVLMLWTGVHHQYHRPNDDLERINGEGLARVSTFAARMVLGLAERPDRPAFIRTTSPRPRGRTGGFRVALGTIPDYAREVQGVALSGVRPSSPAERGGIRAGDIIVAVGDTEVRNIYDYVAALRALEAGVEVTVAVERDGARHELTVVPAPR